MAGITLSGRDPWANIGGNLDGGSGGKLMPGAGGGMDWMTLGSSFVSGLGGGLGKSGPSSAMSRADNNQIDFDHSGWVVQFGDGTVTTDRQQLPAIGGGLNTTTLLLVIGGLVALKIWAKREKSK